MVTYTQLISKYFLKIVKNKKATNEGFFRIFNKSNYSAPPNRMTAQGTVLVSHICFMDGNMDCLFFMVLIKLRIRLNASGHD
ncbi:hypothetical protein CON67_21735 [Bacillus toyonensis]|nr:hypothetical protein CON67_21735 [Bacillus toyonensis]